MKIKSVLWTFGLVVFVASLHAGVWADEWPFAESRELRQRLHTLVAGEVQHCGESHIDYTTAMIRFYQVRAFRPAWVDQYGLRPEGAMALGAVHQAADKGLYYADYRNPWLESLLGGMVSRPVIIGAAFDGKQIQLDLVVTEIVLRYAWHRTTGRTNPDMAHFGRPLPKPLLGNLAVALAEALDRGNLESFLGRLGPRHAAYLALQHSLPRYQQVARNGGWAAIDDGSALQLGDCGPRILQLKRRLSVSGDLDTTTETEGLCFDDNLKVAVARFQHRHGLNADGVAGDRTLAALNVPAAQRIRQIELSLERWRWMPTDLGDRYLLVNIPGFQMQMVEAGRVVKTMRTIVGRKRRPTPVLASMITYLEINPYWNVPHRIAREDLLPKIQANPNFIARQDFRVFDGWAPGARELDPAAIDWSAVSEDHFPYRLRQEPAGHNALGRVKFMFANKMSVYLHDTPSKSLFRKSSRPFSSGCVRLEEPLELASLLLDPQVWDPSRLSRAVASNERQVVVLDEPVPVYLVYLTAWVAPDGKMHFREDIYGHDQTLYVALAQSAAARAACRTVPSLPAYAGGYGKARQRM